MMKVHLNQRQEKSQNQKMMIIYLRRSICDHASKLMDYAKSKTDELIATMDNHKCVDVLEAERLIPSGLKSNNLLFNHVLFLQSTLNCRLQLSCQLQRLKVKFRRKRDNLC